MISVIGSLNMDLVTEVSYTPKVGETILGKGLEKIPGGKGANQASTIGKLDGDVQMIGAVGLDEYGESLIENLKKSNVKTSLIKKVNSPTGTAFIMVNENGDNSIVVISGANFDLNEDIILEFKKEILESDFLVLQLEIPLETVKKAVDIGYKNDKFVVLNPAPGKKLSEGILSKIDLITPNESELEILTGKKITDKKSIISGAKYLVNKGVNNVVVTLGEEGCILVNKNKSKEFPAIKVNPVDTTAAGDSFTGALVTALDQGKNIEEGIIFATKVAACSVMKKGAQTSLPSREEIPEILGGILNEKR